MAKQKTNCDLIPDELLDRLLFGCANQDDLTGEAGEDGILVQPRSRLISRATTGVEDGIASYNRLLDAVHLPRRAVRERLRAGFGAPQLGQHVDRRLLPGHAGGPRHPDGVIARRAVWLKVINELMTCGVLDILLMCCDRLTGFPDAIESVVPQATVRCYIVHMTSTRSATRASRIGGRSWRSYSWDDTAASRLEAQAVLAALEAKRCRRYEMISASWRTNWERVPPFLDLPPEIRRVAYTTNRFDFDNKAVYSDVFMHMTGMTGLKREKNRMRARSDAAARLGGGRADAPARPVARADDGPRPVEYQHVVKRGCSVRTGVVEAGCRQERPTTSSDQSLTPLVV